jgi:hypothetical protein
LIDGQRDQDTVDGIDQVPGLAVVASREQPVGQLGVWLVKAEFGVTVLTVGRSRTFDASKHRSTPGGSRGGTLDDDTAGGRRKRRWRGRSSP